MATPGAAVFPGWDQLNFSRDCSAYGQWLAAFIAPNPWTPDEALGGSIPLSIKLLASALPPGWTFHDNSSSTGGENITVLEAVTSSAGTAYFSDAMQWFVAHMYTTWNETDQLWYADPDFVDNVVWAPSIKCDREFCKAIAFTGNADLSGIGIVIAYYIEASVTTIYLAIFSWWRIWRFINKKKRRRALAAGGGAVNEKVTTNTPAAPPRGRIWRAGVRLFDALRGTFDSFFTAAAVLALAILVAVIVMETNHIHENHRHPVDSQNIPSGHALYDSALGLLVGLYSVFPVIVLYSIWPQETELIEDDDPPSPQDDTEHQQHHHVQRLPSGDVLAVHATPAPASHHEPRRGQRTWLRRGLLIVLWGLAAAVVFLDPRSELDEEYQGIIPLEEDLDDENDNSFAIALYACDQRGGRKYWQALYASQYLVIGVPVLWMLLTVLVYFLTGRFFWGNKRAGDQRSEGEEAAKNGFQQLGRPVWRHAVAWVATGIMWFILLCLTELRHNINVVADGLDTTNEWEFGQVLAIAAWGPPAVDFLYLLIFGIEEGLGGRLPLDFTIRHVTSTSQVDVTMDDRNDSDGSERSPERGPLKTQTQLRADATSSGSNPATHDGSVISRTNTNTFHSANTNHDGDNVDDNDNDSKAAIMHEVEASSPRPLSTVLPEQAPSSLSAVSGPQTTQSSTANNL
ncbi:hypothetical protein SBRCBS47491_001184 [Sporothrix bragantina]|uniref:Uncharacterized protein n=1 Tax=Sporothrix bragantina TaxID=671064 RepID=A0ABP0AWG0_9PEZI